MTSKEDLPHVMSRRNFLKTSAFAGAGLGLGTAGLLRSAQAQAITTISFQGWAFEPQVVEASVKRFMAENPDIRVNYTPLDLQLYAEKMVALFNAGTQGDAFYVRDTHLGAWVEAGWLQPIDGLPKLAELNRDIYPATLQTLFYKGKQYGVPYYGDIYVYLYDKSELAKAGVKKVPVTLDELKNAALEVKKAGISQYPILKGYKTNTDGLDEFWSMVFASGGHLFNASMDPLFPNEDKTAVMVLEWMLDAMHTWKILDPRGLEIDETQARDIYLSGQGTFASNVGNVFPRANNPALSKRAGNIQMMRFPGLKDVNKGPMGWSRLYAMSSQTKHRDAAWRLLYFMGGKDANGRYDVAKESVFRSNRLSRIRTSSLRRKRRATTWTYSGSNSERRKCVKMYSQRGMPNGIVTRSSKFRMYCCAKSNLRKQWRHRRRRPRSLKRVRADRRVCTGTQRN
jgi:multiple sugar transport system substrate-binding protein